MTGSLKLRGVAAVAAVALAASGAAFVLSHSGSPSAASAAPGRGGVPPAGARPGGGMDVDLKAAASYLGLTTSELRTQLRSGTTLATLAAAHGRTTAGLVEAILAAERRGHDATQKAQLATVLRERIEQFVTSTGPPATGPPLS